MCIRDRVKNRTLKKSVQTVVYLPHFLSWVVLALVVKNLFSVDGSINACLLYTSKKNTQPAPRLVPRKGIRIPQNASCIM